MGFIFNVLGSYKYHYAKTLLGKMLWSPVNLGIYLVNVLKTILVLGICFGVFNVYFVYIVVSVPFTKLQSAFYPVEAARDSEEARIQLKKICKILRIEKDDGDNVSERDNLIVDNCDEK